MTADQRPKLTIRATCPTCGGNRHISNSTRIDGGNITICGPCPDCTDGTITQAVSCAGCKLWSQSVQRGGLWGLCQGPVRATTAAEFGCLAWEPREGER